MAVFLDEIPNEVSSGPLPTGTKPPRVSIPLDEVDGMTTSENILRKDFDLVPGRFSDEEANAIKAKGKIGYFEQSIRMKKMEKIPVLGMGVAVYEAAALRRAIGRLQEDKYGDNQELKQRDFETADKAIKYAAEEQLRGFTWGGGIIEGASQLPAYMIEFALSTMVAAPGSATAARAVTAGVARSAAVQGMAEATSWATRAAIRTGTVFAPKVVSGTYRNETALNLTPTEKGLQLNEQAQSAPFTSFAKALGDTAIEVFSEEAGSMVFNPVLSKMAGAPLIAQVGKKMSELYKRLHPSDKLGKLFTKAGWDGFVSEIGEEVLGDQLRAVFNVQDFGAKDGNTLDRMIAAIPDGDEMMVMMGVLAVPGAAHVAAQGGLAALDDYRAKKQALGQEVQPFTEAKTLAQSLKQQGYDPVKVALEEALKPLPQMELSKEELEKLNIAPRTGGVAFEESKPAPERKIVEEITSSKEFKEADREKQMQMLIKGRTAELDVQRTSLEDRMTALEKDIADLENPPPQREGPLLKDTKKSIARQLTGEGRENVNKIIEGKKLELVQLSKELMSVHAQLADAVDMTAEELSREKVLLPGESIDSLRGKAREVGARMERSRVETVFRNLKAQAEERRTALVKYLQARLPGSENAKLREKYNLRAAKDMTEEKLQKFFAEVEKLRETVRAKQLRERAESILDKMRSKIVEGIKRGVFANANIQTLADEVIQIAEMPAPIAEKELSNLAQQLSQLDEMGEGQSEAADSLRYKAELLSKISGLEQRNADQLEDAIRFLSKKLAEFQTGRDVVKELRKAQRKAEETAVVSDIRKVTWTPKNGVTKIVQLVGQKLSHLYEFSTFHEQEFWHRLGPALDSTIQRLVVDPLSAISRHTAALQISMDRPVRRVVEEIYGISKDGYQNFFKFLTERMTLNKTNNPDTEPYLKKVTLNSGIEKDFKLSRMDVLYWYASAYQEEGVQDPEAYEILTGENELAALEEQAKLELGTEADEQAIEDAVAERAKEMKGNAIPADILEEMFATLTEKDRKFAMAMRKIFTSFWPLINPIYSRITGVDLTRVESYIPRIRKTTSVKTVEDMFTQFAMIEAHVTPFPGSVKERRSTSTAPFAQVGLMDVFMGFRDTMSHWIATHDITARMQAYLKNRAIRDAINEATDGVQDKATGEWRDGSFVRLMDFHLKGIASRGRTDNTLRMPAMDFLRRNLSRALLFSPKQIGVQLTSSSAAIIKVGFINYVKGVSSFLRDPVGAYQLMDKALSLHNRYGNTMQEVKEIHDLIRLKRDRFRDKFNWMDKLAFVFVAAGDRASISLGGWAVLKAEYAKSKDLNAAYNSFDDFVHSLQQSALREHQTAATVGPHKYLFQFLSAVSQYGRAYYRSWADAVRDPSKENLKVWARTMVVFHFLIPTAMWMVSNIGAPPPEDEEEEDKRKLRLLFAGITGPFSGLWLIGSSIDLLATAITGEKSYDSGPAVIQYIDKTKEAIVSAVQTAMSEDAEPEDVLMSIFKAEKRASGLTMGIPSWLNNSIEMLYLHSQGEWEDDWTTGVLYGQSIEMMQKMGAK